MTGDRNPETVVLAIRRRFGLVRGAYEKALVERPNLDGRVIVEFEIEPSGKVNRADVFFIEEGPDGKDAPEMSEALELEPMLYAVKDLDFGPAKETTHATVPILLIGPR